MGLEERHDKRDAIALAASLTGFHVEFFKGVQGEDVLDKAKPPVRRHPVSRSFRGLTASHRG